MKMMDNQWGVRLERVEAKVRVGIHRHEREPQRIIVDSYVWLAYGGAPQTIADCFNYEIVYERVTQDWPLRPHTPLLETLVLDLLQHIFASDPRVLKARVGVGKPDVFVHAANASVQLQWTREEFEQYTKG